MKLTDNELNNENIDDIFNIEIVNEFLDNRYKNIIDFGLNKNIKELNDFIKLLEIENKEKLKKFYSKERYLSVYLINVINKDIYGKDTKLHERIFNLHIETNNEYEAKDII